MLPSFSTTNEAITFYHKVIKINPNSVNAQFNLGVLFYEQKELKKAKVFFKKTTEIQPNYALAFSNLGNVHAELKEYENAISSYQKAIELRDELVSKGLEDCFVVGEFKNKIISSKEALNLLGQ